MGRTVTDDEFDREFQRFTRSAWRFEQQPQYDVGYERAQYDAFLAGHPQSPMDNPELGAWMRQVAGQVAAGKTIGRVRVVDEPLTDYQRWMRWMDRWNREAGETIDYLRRGGLDRFGARPWFGPAADWWLFDEGTPDARLMIMHFDELGVRVRVELSNEPREIALAETWRDLMVLAARREHHQIAS